MVIITRSMSAKMRAKKKTYGTEKKSCSPSSSSRNPSVMTRSMSKKAGVQLVEAELQPKRRKEKKKIPSSSTEPVTRVILPVTLAG